MLILKFLDMNFDEIEDCFDATVLYVLLWIYFDIELYYVN